MIDLQTTNPVLFQLSKLREPFPENQIGTIPKKDKTTGKTVHLEYVGHAALTARLLEVDPLWTWEPMGRTPEGLPARDENGGLWIRLTVCGVTRPGYGHATKTGGDGMKEIIGDALRNAAMRFGAALELWHKGGGLYPDDKSVKDDEETDQSQSNDPRRARADELLKMYQTAENMDAIDAVTALFTAEWRGDDGLKHVPGLAESITAMKTSAIKRVGG